MRFVGNLILNTSCEFDHDDVTTVINIAVDTALALKASVIRFLWAKGLNANAIHTEMHPVYGDKRCV